MGANSFDAVERLAHVAAFAVSGFAAAKLRSSRKPFNPMLVRPRRSSSRSIAD